MLRNKTRDGKTPNKKEATKSNGLSWKSKTEKAAPPGSQRSNQRAWLRLRQWRGGEHEICPEKPSHFFPPKPPSKWQMELEATYSFPLHSHYKYIGIPNTKEIL